MIESRGRFSAALGGSAALHVIVLGALFSLPAPAGQEMVRIYKVQVVEAPARPKVRDLTLSTRPISGLKLDAPSLSIQRPDVEPSDDEPELPALAPLTPAPAEPVAPAARAEPIPPAAQPAAPRAMEPIRVPQPELPAAPRSLLPPAPPSATRPSSPVRDRPSPPRAPVAPPLPPRVDPLLRPGLTPLEAVREKVSKLELRFEEQPPSVPKPGAPAGQSGPSSPLSLRIFLSQVREAIKDNYSFPGGFEEGLQVRVRLTLLKDGTLEATEVVTSSGNPRFDHAALIALRRTTFPPLPEGFEEETFTRVIVFSP